MNENLPTQPTETKEKKIVKWLQIANVVLQALAGIFSRKV